jgi:transcriptional regulator with XRE-family HTH domain
MNVVLNTIRLIRLEKKLSQEYVASKLNFTQSYFAKMENGESDISARNLLLLLDILEIDPVDFFKEVKRKKKLKK